MNLSLLDLPDNESRTGSDSPRSEKYTNCKTLYLYAFRYILSTFTWGTWAVEVREYDWE